MALLTYQQYGASLITTIKDFQRNHLFFFLVGSLLRQRFLINVRTCSIGAIFLPLPFSLTLFYLCLMNTVANLFLLCHFFVSSRTEKHTIDLHRLHVEEAMFLEHALASFSLGKQSTPFTLGPDSVCACVRVFTILMATSTRKVLCQGDSWKCVCSLFFCCFLFFFRFCRRSLHSQCYYRLGVPQYQRPEN